MSDLLTYVILYGLYAATICFLFVMLFINDLRQWWLRAATVAMGLWALVFPFLIAGTTLGYPDPWPPPGEYRVLGWEIDEAEGVFYLFVEADGDPVPRHYRLPFELATALKLQEAQDNVGVTWVSVAIAEGPSKDRPRAQFAFETAFGSD